jgi:hypothetical protein
MAGGHEPTVDVAEPRRLAISDRRALLRTVAAFHDRERLGRRQHGAMPAARMIGMAMRHERARLRRRRVDPRIGGGQIEPLRVGFDPGSGAGHGCNMIAQAGGFHPR